MNTKFFFAALVCCMGLGFASEASANSWRVNYDMRANADFQDLNAAMADERVVDGDIIYMDKGCTISIEQTITKAVTVIGPGYFIGENDADEAYFSNNIYLKAKGIKLTGLHTSTIYIYTSENVIERCRVTGNIIAQDYETDNVAIRSNFIDGQIKGLGYNGSKGWNILNNILYRHGNQQNIFSPIYNFYNALIDHNAIHFYNSGAYYNNNYGYCIHDVYNSTITNNLIRQYYGTKYNVINTASLGCNNIISHNVLSYQTAYSDYPNNKFNMTNVYANEREAAPRDQYYELADDSPAKGYAEDGGDCGPWDGAYPYVLSGYPLYVPRFESITVPSQPDESGNLKIQMVIKNQNK